MHQPALPYHTTATTLEGEGYDAFSPRHVKPTIHSEETLFRIQKLTDDHAQFWTPSHR